METVATLPKKLDVLIVGGGPAGSSAATSLARRGYDVAVIDRRHHPRETVGESILPSAWKYFDLLGVSDAIVRDGFVKKAGGVVVWGDDITQIAFRDFAYDRPGLHVERDALDELLLRNAAAAGARVLEGISADAFEHDERDGARVAISDRQSGEATQILCRYLIDASGQASFLAQHRGGRKLDDDFRFVSLWGYFRNSRYVASGGIIRPFDDVPQHPPMTFVTRLKDWGWSWHIPLRRETSVGIVVPIADYKREIARYSSINDYYSETCAQTKFLGALLEGAALHGHIRTIRDYSYLPDSVAGPGYFTIGDAAGFVDPIFSVGVVMALYSGHLVSWAIDRALRSPATALATQMLFSNQMRGRYELARMMALPGVDTEPPALARSYFNFFSKDEKDLMWSAASMTTRSPNIAKAAGGAHAPALKRRQLAALQFA